MKPAPWHLDVSVLVAGRRPCELKNEMKHPRFVLASANDSTTVLDVLWNDKIATLIQLGKGKAKGKRKAFLIRALGARRQACEDAGYSSQFLHNSIFRLELSKLLVEGFPCRLEAQGPARIIVHPGGGIIHLGLRHEAEVRALGETCTPKHTVAVLVAASLA